jgi:ABC-type Na+ transport system ATPase subunit NatA
MQGPSADTDRLDDFLSLRQKYNKASFPVQVYILLKKNMAVCFRKWTFILAHILTLGLVCGVILAINGLTKYAYENEPSRIYPVENVNDLTKCDFHPSCKSFGYIVIGNREPWVNYTVDYIVNKTGFNPNTDVKLLYEGNNITQALTDIKTQNNNSFSTIVILCTSEFQIANQTISCTLFGTKTYWLLYNQTLVKQNFLDNMNAPLKLSMDAIRTARMVENALSNYILNQELQLNVQIEHNYTSQDFPKVQSRMLIDFDTSSSQGSFWFYIPVMVSFLNLNTEVIGEKERRLRQGLMLFGVSSGAYWLSWLIFAFLFDLVFGFLIAISGVICRFSFFTECPFYILYLTFFSTLFSTHMLGFMLCSLVGDNKSGSKYGYSIMLISIFYQIFFSNGIFLELIYTEDKPWGINLLLAFMYINPSFHFANIIVNIIYKSGNHFNNQTTMWEKGVPYLWEYFTQEVSGSLFNRPYTKPSPLQSMYGIIYDTAGYLLLLWLFDNVVATNRGFSQNPFKGWFRCFTGQKMDRHLVVHAAGGEMDTRPHDLRAEVEVDDEKAVHGVVLQNLWKSYKPSWARGKDPRSDYALRNVNLQIRQGELLALLGPNGAGKTTMIGIISGLLAPTKGSFFSNGLDADSHREDIRKMTNVCPQFDILWDEMSVFDHIKMVGQIKGVAHSDLEKLAKSVLAVVNLESTLNEKIGNLSGGMKRRVSIALATIGNPSVLVFDEPTTGLDPENRRVIWRFINRMKESNRTILLTTHLLEEVMFI